jgi:hypothetical protein
MGFKVYDGQIVLHLNDAWTAAAAMPLRIFQKFVGDFARAISTETLNILLIGDAGKSIGKRARDLFGEAGFAARVTSTDVTFAGAPWVEDGVDDVSMKLDTTEKFTAPKRKFQLVLGRRVVCLCNVHEAGGPCGFPPGGAAQAAKFLRRVGKSLAPGGVAYLHGDPPGMTKKAEEYWLAAKAALAVYGPAGDGGGKSRKDYFDVDLIYDSGAFVGIKISRAEPPAAPPE